MKTINIITSQVLQHSTSTDSPAVHRKRRTSTSIGKISQSNIDLGSYHLIHKYNMDPEDKRYITCNDW